MAVTKHECDVFISYATEDLNAFVEPLAHELRAHGLKLWFAEQTVNLGESLSRTIDSGLIASRFGLIILSRNYMRKRWTMYELQSLIAREIEEGVVILPIWLGLEKEEVLSFSPWLADKVALRAEGRAVGVIAKEIASAIRDKAADSQRERTAQGPAPVRNETTIRQLYSMAAEMVCEVPTRVGWTGMGDEERVGEGEVIDRKLQRLDKSLEPDRDDFDNEIIQDPRRVLQRASTLVLLGEAGTGKTTLLLTYFRELLQRWQVEEGVSFPVFVPVRVWQQNGRSKSLDAVVSHLLTTRGSIPQQAVRRWLDGPTTWLIDGLDEVGDQEFTVRVCRFLEGLARTRSARGDRVVISSRPERYRTCRLAAPFEEWVLQPLSETEVRRLVHRYTALEEEQTAAPINAGVRADRMVRLCEEEPWMRHPLFLQIALQSNARVSSRVGVLAEAGPVLLTQWSNRLAVNHGGAPEDIQHALGSSLAQLALETMQRETSSVLNTAIAEILAQGGSSLSASTLCELFDGLTLTNAGLPALLVQPQPHHVSWSHVAFQESFAALALSQLKSSSPDSFASFVDEHRMEGRWSRVWDLLAWKWRGDPASMRILADAFLKTASGSGAQLLAPELRVLSWATWSTGSTNLFEHVWKTVLGSSFDGPSVWLVDRLARIVLETRGSLPSCVTAFFLKLRENVNVSYWLGTTVIRCVVEVEGAASYVKRVRDSSDHNKGALVRLSSAVLDVPEIYDLVRELAVAADPGVRHAALEALLEHSANEVPLDLLWSGAFSHERPLAETSLAALARRSSDVEVSSGLMKVLDECDGSINVGKVIRQFGEFSILESVAEWMLARAGVDSGFATDWDARAFVTRNIHSRSVARAVLSAARSCADERMTVAIELLGEMNLDAEVALLLRELASSPADAVRVAAFRAIGMHGVELGEDWDKLLYGGLEDPDKRVRAAATMALRHRVAVNRVCGDLIEHERDSAWRVRLEVARSLEAARARPDARAALKRLCEDEHVDVVFAAIESLRADDPSVIDILEEKVASGITGVRLRAAKLLGPFVGQSKVRRIARALCRDEDSSVRAEAMKSLVWALEPQERWSALCHGARDAEYYAVRAEAYRSAIRNARGERLPQDIIEAVGSEKDDYVLIAFLEAIDVANVDELLGGAIRAMGANVGLLSSHWWIPVMVQLIDRPGVMEALLEWWQENPIFGGDEVYAGLVAADEMAGRG